MLSKKIGFQMKTALVRVNYNSNYVVPPLGLGYMASYAQKFGHEVLIIDALRDNLPNDKVVEMINSADISAVGITCLSIFYEEVVDLSKKLKKNGKKVFIGGIHPTFNPKQTLIDSEADYVSIGEGEISFKKLLDANFDGEGIQGIYNLDNLPENPLKGERVENLDELPMPDWSQMAPVSYPILNSGEISKSYPTAIIATTRGCPFSCKFCVSPAFYDRKIRFRSPENVVDEIEFLVKNFGVKEIHFEDDNSTLNREHAYEICRLLVERKIKIDFTCPNGIRSEVVDFELMKMMKNAGCYCISYGIESANYEILEKIGKKENLDLIKKSIEMAEKCGILTKGFFLFGLDGETKQTVKNTVDYALSSKLTFAEFNVLSAVPYEKTPDEKSENAEILSAKYLVKAKNIATLRFYLRFEIIWKIFKTVVVAKIISLFRNMGKN